MFMEERHREILKILERNKRISVSEIENRFGVSVDSARRDLRILEGKGLLQRTHGGAIPLGKAGAKPKDDPREMQVLDNYDAIARRAAGMIQENDTVYITGGSVGYLMTKYLKNVPPFTMVTNSLLLADEMKSSESVTVYLTGGRMGAKGTMVDALAIDFVKNMHFDISFLSGAGFSAAFGFSSGVEEAAGFQKAVIAGSTKAVALMPHQKVGFSGFIKVASAESFHMVITDWMAFDEELCRLMDLGVEVVVVDNPHPTPKVEIII